MKYNKARVAKFAFYLSTIISVNAIADVSNIENTTNPSELEEIVVYADRSETPLKNASYSVDKIIGSQIARSSTAYVDETLFESHAWVNRGNGQEHLTAIRSPVFTGAGACGNFLVTEDGIATRAPGFCNVNQLFDVFYELADSVEVYRGPASASRGGSALFGGLDFYTPSFNTSFASLTAGTTNYTNARWSLSSSQNDSEDNVQLLFGSVTKNNGVREQSGTDQQKLGYKYHHNLAGWQATHTLLLNNLEQETAGFIEGIDAYKNKDVRESNPSPEAYRDVKSARAYSQFEREFNSARVALTPYVRWHKMEFLMHFVGWQPTEKNGHRSVGFNGVWEQLINDNLRLLTSADVDLTNGYLSEVQANDAPFSQEKFPVGTHYNYEVGAKRYALSSRLDSQITDALQVSTTLRFDSINYDYKTKEPAGSDCEASVEDCRFFRPENGISRYNNLSWRWAVNYSLSDNLALYVNRGTAFRAPQTSELYRAQSADTSQLNEVNLTGSELGLRYNSKKIHTHIAVFKQRQKNGIYQNSERQYLLGADTSHNGVELSASASPLSNLKITLLSRYESHKYKNSPEVLGVSSNITGNMIDTAPKQSHKLITRWAINTNQSLAFRINKQGSYYLNPDNTAEYEGHTLLDISYAQKLTSALELKIDINNVIDKDHATRADFAFGDYRYFPGEERSLRVGVEMSF